MNYLYLSYNSQSLPFLTAYLFPPGFSGFWRTFFGAPFPLAFVL